MNKYKYQIFTLSVRTLALKWWWHYISFKFKQWINKWKKMTPWTLKIYITQFSSNFNIKRTFGDHKISSIYRWGNTGSERLNDLPKVTHLKKSRDKRQTQTWSSFQKYSLHWLWALICKYSTQSVVTAILPLHWIKTKFHKMH